MKIVEWRIIYPFEMSHFVHAQEYMVAKRQREESGNGEGVELVTREPFSLNDESGMYTHKVYHYKSRIPAIIRWLVPNSLTDFHEEAWGAFPHEWFRYNVPALEKRISIMMDCYSYPFNKEEGFPDNPAHLTEEELAIREIRYMDIVTMPPIPERKDWNLANFSCPEVGIERIAEPTRPFDSSKIPEWVESYKGKMMLNVRCIKCKIGIWGIQNKVEKLISETSVPSILLESARAITGWASEWGKMSPEELQEFTRQSDQDVNNQIVHENPDEKNKEKHDGKGHHHEKKSKNTK